MAEVAVDPRVGARQNLPDALGALKAEFGHSQHAVGDPVERIYALAAQPSGDVGVDRNHLPRPFAENGERFPCGLVERLGGVEFDEVGEVSDLSVPARLDVTDEPSDPEVLGAPGTSQTAPSSQLGTLEDEFALDVHLVTGGPVGPRTDGGG